MLKSKSKSSEGKHSQLNKCQIYNFWYNLEFWCSPASGLWWTKTLSGYVYGPCYLCSRTYMTFFCFRDQRNPLREGWVALVILQLRAGQNMYDCILWGFFPQDFCFTLATQQCMGENTVRATWIWAVTLGRVSYGNALVALLPHLQCSYIFSLSRYLRKKVRGELETNTLYLKLCKDPC